MSTLRSGAPAQEIVAAEFFSCALTARGDVFCWGRNTSGMLGTGDFDDATTPRRVLSDVSFGTLSGAGAHVCALARGGEAYCWGQNGSGELGAETTDVCVTAGNQHLLCSAVPVAVSGGLKFHVLDAGWRHNCGLTADGTAYCWGWNQFGQLGTQTTEMCLSDGVNPAPCSHTPVAVDGGLRFRSISAGFWQTCGLTFDDEMYCWGRNALGTFGNGTSAPLAGATPIAGGSGVLFRSLSSGAGAACGITPDRVTMCWGGFNQSGELGDGTNVRHLTPQPVAGDFVDVRSVNTMTENNILAHVCAIGPQGEARCWGSNQRGQLGAETTQVCHFSTIVFGCSNVPVVVSGDHSFRSIATGNEHTCGVTMQGEVFCWGFNRFGQVGDGTTTDRSEPAGVQLP